MKSIQIAIDGPASSGKSTVAKIIAKQLGYTYLDTGAMYRSATFLALKNGIEVSNQEKIVELLESNPIRFGRDENGGVSHFRTNDFLDIKPYYLDITVS